MQIYRCCWKWCRKLRSYNHSQTTYIRQKGSFCNISNQPDRYISLEWKNRTVYLYRIKYKKRWKKIKKTLAFFWEVVYTLNCCDIDSNEARGCCHRDGRFSVERMSSLKTDDKSLYKFRRPSRDGVCAKNSKDTHGDVYSRRLSYCLKSTNRRRLFLWQIR